MGKHAGGRSKIVLKPEREGPPEEVISFCHVQVNRNSLEGFISKGQHLVRN